jgi:hypothetical protein
MGKHIDDLVKKISEVAPPRSNGLYDTGRINNAIALIIQGRSESMSSLTWRNLRYLSAWVAWKANKGFRPTSHLMLMVGSDWLRDYGPKDRPFNDPPPVDRYNTIDGWDLKFLVTVAAWQKKAGLSRIPSTDWPSAYKKITSWAEGVDHDPPAEMGTRAALTLESLPWFDEKLEYSVGTKVPAAVFAKSLARTFPTVTVSARSIATTFPQITAFSVDHYVTACRIISNAGDPPPMSTAGAKLIEDLNKRGVAST